MDFVCPNCLNTGHACEYHPNRPFEHQIDFAECGGAGMPCPTCCGARLRGSGHSIREAFIPRHLRDR